VDDFMLGRFGKNSVFIDGMLEAFSADPFTSISGRRSLFCVFYFGFGDVYINGIDFNMTAVFFSSLPCVF
jgi:hypothetical protein